MNLNWSTVVRHPDDATHVELPTQTARKMRFLDRRGSIRTANINGELTVKHPSPRGAECLTKILATIRSRRGASQPLELYLHVLDDIDFDCQQPLLAEVLGELFTNAATALQGQANARIDFMTTQYKNRLFVQVSDNGPGMPEGMAKWFEHRKGSVSHKTPHNPSGLDTVGRLLEAAGGDLELVASNANGTRLGFSLPVADMNCTSS